MGKRYSERAAHHSQHEAPRTREPVVFVVSGDSDYLDTVLSQCSDIPERYTVYPNIDDLMHALARIDRLSLAFAVIVEKKADDIDAPLLRRCKLEYPALNYILVLGECSQASFLRFQSIGIQNILLPPYDEVSLANEIATALPNIPQFKRRPDLMARGMVQLDFLIPNDLSYVLGINYLISLLLKEFSYPPADYRINIPLACDEALTNAILHGNESDPARKVSVHIYVSSSRFKIKIKDQGEGFDFASVADPTDRENLMRSSGRGVYLMQSIMDTVTYTDGGRTVELEKTNGNSLPNDKKKP
jgi:serine/threonine-protein kinase RsbW